jgi:tetratricopeptide (TPR) repeat protein
VQPAHWNRVKDLLSVALKRPAAERAAALEALCGDDLSLRDEVAGLLEGQEEMGSFLEPPLLDVTETETGDEEGVSAALRQWTHYQVLERLGRGGMAVVHKAWDPRLHRAVAIKLISGRDDLTVRRFLREAEAQAAVDHDNVLKVYETGVVGDYYYIAMQYVNGPTLLGVRADTTIDQKVALILRIADGLHAAHRRGLVHRDIKPSNILVEEGADGLKPYLLDFGLAVELGAPSLTRTGMVFGTPRYMAPERIHGGTAALDRRSDIYSLGATCYEFLSGTPPFPSASGLQVLVHILEGEFTPLRVLQPAFSPELDAIVAKCLEKDPRARYPSARALADDLQRYLNGDAVSARPTGRMGRLAKRARKYPRLAVAFATMAALTLGGAAWGAYQYGRSARQATLAQQLGQEIRDVEWLFRAAQMSPIHAIEPQKRQVRERIADLERIMAQAGSLAFGPGHYALGRARLTLGDSTKALEDLNLAWHSGYRTADAAAALGLAHDEIFRAEMGRAQRIAADGDRAARIRALEAEHRDPALRFFEEGQSSSIVPSRYVAALIAALRGDAPTAIAHADAAARETPWLFEARLLAGDLEFKEAVNLYIKGLPDEAAAYAARADGYYTEAAHVAASSVAAYLGRCAVAGLVVHMISHRLQADPEPVHRQAEESCAQAVLVEPDGAEGYRLSAEALQSWTIANVNHGKDPGDAYERAARFAERAMSLSGGGLEARLALADILLDRAWWEDKAGKHTPTVVDQAVAAYGDALAIDPRNVAALNNRGQALLLKSRLERAGHVDPAQMQDRAVAEFERTLGVDPTTSSAFRNLTRAALERADEQARHGLDVVPGLTQVLRFLDQLPGDPARPTFRADAVRQLRGRLAAPRG